MTEYRYKNFLKNLFELMGVLLILMSFPLYTSKFYIEEIGVKFQNIGLEDATFFFVLGSIFLITDYMFFLEFSVRGKEFDVVKRVLFFSKKTTVSKDEIVNAAPTFYKIELRNKKLYFANFIWLANGNTNEGEHRRIMPLVYIDTPHLKRKLESSW